MAMEKYRFKGADGKNHQLKRLMDCPSKKAQKFFESFEEAGLNSADEAAASQDISKFLGIAFEGLEMAFIGSEKEFEKAVEEMSLKDVIELLNSWLSDEAEVDSKKG